MSLRQVPNVPAPVGAIHVYDWSWDSERTPLNRSFDIAMWAVDGDRIAVDLSGKQHADGTVELEVLTHLPKRPLTADEARRVGVALLAAADGAEHWAAANTTAAQSY